jgi:hypothetical protein
LVDAETGITISRFCGTADPAFTTDIRLDRAEDDVVIVSSVAIPVFKFTVVDTVRWLTTATSAVRDAAVAAGQDFDVPDAAMGPRYTLLRAGPISTEFT